MGTLADIIGSGVRAEDLDPELAQKLDPLLRFVNQGIGGLQQQLQNNLTLTDNLSCEVVTPTLSHGVAQLVQLKKLSKAGMVGGYGILGQKNGPNHGLLYPPILQSTATPGQVKITCYFLDPTAVRVQMSILLFPEGGASSASVPAGNPAAEYTTTAAQSIANNTVTVVNYDTLVKDTDSAVSVGAGWKFTCPSGKGGEYLVSANATFNASPGVGLTILLFKNGSRLHDLNNLVLTAGSTFVAGAGVGGATSVTLAAGDTIDVRVFQSSGGPVALTANAYQNRIAIKRLP